MHLTGWKYDPLVGVAAFIFWAVLVLTKSWNTCILKLSKMWAIPKFIIKCMLEIPVPRKHGTLDLGILRIKDSASLLWILCSEVPTLGFWCWCAILDAFGLLLSGKQGSGACASWNNSFADREEVAEGHTPMHVFCSHSIAHYHCHHRSCGHKALEKEVEPHDQAVSSSAVFVCKLLSRACDPSGHQVGVQIVGENNMSHSFPRQAAWTISHPDCYASFASCTLTIDWTGIKSGAWLDIRWRRN